jgi:hypothetical protein
LASVCFNQSDDFTTPISPKKAFLVNLLEKNTFLVVIKVSLKVSIIPPSRGLQLLVDFRGKEAQCDKLEASDLRDILAVVFLFFSLLHHYQFHLALRSIPSNFHIKESSFVSLVILKRFKCNLFNILVDIALATGILLKQMPYVCLALIGEFHFYFGIYGAICTKYCFYISLLSVNRLYSIILKLIRGI